MKLAEKIEHLEHWIFPKENDYKPWRLSSHSRKWMKKMQHRAWRRWSKDNLNEDSNNPMYTRYQVWEY